MNRRLGYVSFLAAAMIYGTFGLFVRALQTNYDALQQVVLRSAAAGLITIPLALATTSAPDWAQLKNPRLIVFAFMFPLSITLWTWATIFGTVRSSIFGLYLGSLIGAVLLGKLFFQEGLTPRRCAGIMLSFVGLIIFCLPSATSFSYGPSLLLGSLAGLGQAFALCLRRWLSDVNRNLILAAQSAGPLIVCGALCALLDPFSLTFISNTQLVVSFGYGVLVVLVSYLVLIGSQNLEISKGSIILSTELIWAVTIAAIFLNEMPQYSEIIGSLSLLSAAVIVKDDD